MKKILSFLLALLTLLCVSYGSLSPYAYCLENPYSQFIADPYYEVTNGYINEIVDKLVKLPASGSVCIDYLAEEILLHRAILFASNNIESYSSNPELIDITDDIIDNYTGELREMRDELAKLIDSLSKDKNITKDDSEYIKQYKVIINKLANDLSQIKKSDSNELDYIKQIIAILQASHDISSLDNDCTKSDLVKKTAKDEITNTQQYISRLKVLEKAFEK